jgi:tetratricopeptide (TPR) repeat protein
MALNSCDTSLLSQSLMVLGMAYAKLKKPEAVKLYLKECVAFKINGLQLVHAYNSLSDAYLQDKQWETARFYANKALETGVSISDIYSQAMSYQRLYFIEKDEENYKEALAHYDKCVYLKDSINELENRNNVLEIQ